MIALVQRWPLAVAGALMAAVAVLGVVYAASADGPEGHAGNGGAHGTGASIERTETAVQFRQDMRKLWEDHITWTRLFIVSFAADLPDQEQTAGRLLQNQVDIGDAIKPYYGDAAGSALTQLLNELHPGRCDAAPGGQGRRRGGLRVGTDGLVRQRRPDRLVPPRREPGKLAPGRHPAPHDHAP